MGENACARRGVQQTHPPTSHRYRRGKRLPATTWWLSSHGWRGECVQRRDAALVMFLSHVRRRSFHRISVLLVSDSRWWLCLGDNGGGFLELIVNELSKAVHVLLVLRLLLLDTSRLTGRTSAMTIVHGRTNLGLVRVAEMLHTLILVFESRRRNDARHVQTAHRQFRHAGTSSRQVDVEEISTTALEKSLVGLRRGGSRTQGAILGRVRSSRAILSSKSFRVRTSLRRTYIDRLISLYPTRIDPFATLGVGFVRNGKRRGLGDRPTLENVRTTYPQNDHTAGPPPYPSPPFPLSLHVSSLSLSTFPDLTFLYSVQTATGTYLKDNVERQEDT